MRSATVSRGSITPLMRSPTDKRPIVFSRQISIFQVACPATDMPAAEQRLWAAEAAQHGWPLYPEAGTGCFKPGRNLLGVAGLKVFSVACPVMALSPTDQRRWVAYSANQGWAPYPQAGEGCVDP